MSDGPLNLTAQEREKFALYLKRDAETDIELAEQMVKLGMASAVSDRYKMRAAAKLLVANELLSIEDMVL